MKMRNGESEESKGTYRSKFTEDGLALINELCIPCLPLAFGDVLLVENDKVKEATEDGSANIVDIDEKTFGIVL